jgi:hypothetical protein
MKRRDTESENVEADEMERRDTESENVEADEEFEVEDEIDQED